MIEPFSIVGFKGSQQQLIVIFLCKQLLQLFNAKIRLIDNQASAQGIHQCKEILKEFKPFKLQHIIVGKPIYLTDYYEKSATINTELINKLTIIVQNEMNKLEQKSKEFVKYL